MGNRNTDGRHGVTRLTGIIASLWPEWREGVEEGRRGGGTAASPKTTWAIHVAAQFPCIVRLPLNIRNT
ncbi:hypothetical protein E2C01_060091 [Portunus trituberculatus]|uniref:Uncharacterized protein n=1 Tax=Portunus trituberculatus TaxID=210409 RepID=A0A5B7H030_PORTR|nr:hypothetical protein [Portunus trituberculatus]